MNKRWKDYDYKAVNLPSILLDEVDQVVNHESFSSRSEFIKLAVREKIDRINTMNALSIIRNTYESRFDETEFNDEIKNLILKISQDISEEGYQESERMQKQWIKLEGLLRKRTHLRYIAKDIIKHFQERQSLYNGKAMISTMSRGMAIDLYNEIIAMKPEWHDDNINDGVIKVVITPSLGDDDTLKKHHTTHPQRALLAKRMKDPNDKMKLAIFCRLWATGIDIPNLSTIYLIKPMNGFEMLNMINKINRIYRGKSGGLIVDYLGLILNMKNAIALNTAAALYEYGKKMDR